MLERYKLRLRDGTVLVVDHDALSSWLVDGKALVQPVGSDRWFPLRQFLAKEKAEAAAAARRNPPPLPAPVAAAPLENGTGLRLAEPPPVSFNEPSASASPPPVPTVDAPVWTSQPPILTSAPPLSASEPPALASPTPRLPSVSRRPSEPRRKRPPQGRDSRRPETKSRSPHRRVTIEPEAPRFADVPAPADPPAPLLSVSEPPEVWAPEPAVAEAQDPPEAWAPDPPRGFGSRTAGGLGSGPARGLGSRATRGLGSDGGSGRPLPGHDATAGVRRRSRGRRAAEHRRTRTAPVHRRGVAEPSSGADALHDRIAGCLGSDGGSRRSLRSHCRGSTNLRRDRRRAPTRTRSFSRPPRR